MNFTGKRFAIAQKTHLHDETTFKPQLTSLVDVMVFLLVFLIKAFSVEGDIITPAKNLTLPISTSQTRPEVIPSIEISQGAIMSDGKVLLETAKLKPNNMLIQPLLAHLNGIAKKSPESLTAHKILIQSDREVNFALVKKVLFTCSKAGFTDYSILVVQKE